MLATPSVDPSRACTGFAFRPIFHSEGADRRAEAPFVVRLLNASFIAQLNVERAFSAASAIRNRLLPLVHWFVSRWAALVRTGALGLPKGVPAYDR